MNGKALDSAGILTGYRMHFTGKTVPMNERV